MNTFSFAYPSLLWLLAAVPVTVGLYLFARWMRIRNLHRLGNIKTLAPLMPAVSPYKPVLKVSLRALALVFLVIAIARPWGGVKDEKTVKRGIEVIIAVDASNSMKASATDSPNGPDRMRTSKLMLEKLINRFDNDRVGLILYAGKPYTLIPVTNDYVSAKMFLNSVDPSMIEDQGTDISAAISMASSSFSNDRNIGKALVLITDVDDLENPEAAVKAAEKAASSGIQVDVVGVGSATPVPIPDGTGYMIDPDTGTEAKTALNSDLASKVAAAGRGIFVNATSGDALNALDRQLSGLKKAAMESSVYSTHDELFGVFAWIALALVVIDMFLLERRITWLDKISFFNRKRNK